MDIREHYITSFFFHIIALLIAAAFSQSHLKAPDTLTVSLSAGPFDQSSVASSDKVKETHEITKLTQLISNDNTFVDTDETPLLEKVTAAEKPEEISPPEKIPESQEQAATGISGTSQETVWLAQIHHSYLMQTRVFMDNFSQSIREGLLKAIESDLAGGLREGTAEVTFFFNDEGGFGEVWGATSSEVLKSALNRLDWQSVPLPGAYRLKLKGLHVKISIEKGEPSLSFTVL